MLRFLILMVVVTVLMVGVAAPQALAQEWKTYLNPEYKFTIQYPYNYFHDSKIEKFDNDTMLNLEGDGINMNINILPLNKTELTNDMALEWITKTYDHEIEDGYYSSLQNITEVDYGGYPGYKMILYNSLDTTYHYAYLQHKNIVLGFYMVDMDESSYEGELFDKIINSTKFF